MVTPETWIPPSGSKLALGEACPASLALPRVKEEAGGAAEIGTGIHAFIEDVAAVLAKVAPCVDLDAARAWALSRVPDGAPWRERCEVLDLERLDLRPDSLHEVGFLLDVATGEVTYQGVGLSHGDIVAAPGKIAIILDRVTDRPDLDRVDVDDWKTGFLPVEAKNNPQLLCGAICAAKHFGRVKARARIVKLPEDGGARIDAVDLDAFDLDVGLQRLGVLVDSGREQVRRRCSGEPLSYTQGKGCRYCPSFTYCEPSIKAIVAMAREPLNLDAEITGLLATASDEDAAKAFEAFEKWDAVAKRIRIALVSRARNRPIPFADGTVYGERRVPKTKLDGEKVFAEIAAVHGPDLAALTVKKKATKKGIREVAKVLSVRQTEAAKALDPKAKKITIGAVEEGIHSFLASQGAETKTTTLRLDRHKPGETATEDDDE